MGESYLTCLCQTGYTTAICDSTPPPTTTWTTTRVTTVSTTSTSMTSTLTVFTSSTTTSTQTQTVLPPTTTTTIPTTSSFTVTKTSSTTIPLPLHIHRRGGKMHSMHTDGSEHGHSKASARRDDGEARQKPIPLMTRALEFGGGLPVAMGIALAGVSCGIMIGLLVAWTCRNIRQCRKTKLVPSPVPTSLCEPAEVRLVESTASSIESGTSMEALLGAPRNSACSKNGRGGMGMSSSSGLHDGPAE